MKNTKNCTLNSNKTHYHSFQPSKAKQTIKCSNPVKRNVLSDDLKKTCPQERSRSSDFSRQSPMFLSLCSQGSHAANLYQRATHSSLVREILRCQREALQLSAHCNTFRLDRKHELIPGLSVSKCSCRVLIDRVRVWTYTLQGKRYRVEDVTRPFVTFPL